MQTGTASQLPAKQSHPPKKKNCFWVFGGFWQKVSCFSPPHCDALATVGSSAARTCVPALLHPRLSILAGGCEQTRGGPVGASGFLSVSAPPRGEGGGGVVDEKDFAPPNAPPFPAHAPWSAMFPQPFAAGVASLRGGWGLVSAIFHIHEHVQWFPRCGLRWPRATGAPGPAVPARGCGGSRFRKQKLAAPPPCPKKTNFLVGVGGN